jgi:bifunctional NMN adenylyltransferase/nudix hydrolase
MVTKQYDYLVFIGRFQPFHLGHLEVMEQAKRLAERVIVLVGSANQPRTPKNPFTYEERELMIRQHFGDDATWLHIKPLRDKPYSNTKWAAQVQHVVASILPWTDMPLRGGIIGHKKDDSSFYLDLFPQWGDPIDHAINELVNATDIRKLYLERNIKYVEAIMPRSSYEFLKAFKEKAAYANVVAEHTFIENYKKNWAAAPRPVTFQTADAVVIQSGHVLLVKRGGPLGRGLMALPGGFVEQGERVLDAVFRELLEETKLKVAEKVLRGSVQKFELFDAPERSLRGRTITHAALIELAAGKLPHVKGSDDAKKAIWTPLSHLREEEMFEDHYHIIDQFVGGLA